MNQTHQLAASERILTIDVLRGLALLGILIAHMIFWYSGGPLPQAFYQAYNDPINGIFMGIHFLLISGKFFAIFSFLFGLSFYIQIKSLSQHQTNPSLRFAWRLAILGVIGILHHIVWRADILSIYVPLGFLLLLSRNLSNKTIFILGSLLVLNIPTKIIEAFWIFTHGTPEFITNNFVADGAKYYATMTSTSFTSMFIDNWHYTKDKWDYQLTSGRVWITFGFFLFGMLAGRKKWFENLDAHIDSFKKVWKKSGLILLTTLVVGIIFGATIFALHLKFEEQPWLRWVAGSLIDVLNTGLTVFYITWIPLLMQKAKWYQRLAPLSSIGKMALTAYLTQTLFGVMLFFSVGFGLLLKTSPGLNVVLAFLVFGLQIAFCKFWLQHFYYGPVEWLWRSATYLKWQPMIKRKVIVNFAEKAET